MATSTRTIEWTRNARVQSVGRFLWHWLQMVIAMELGMMVYHVLVAPLLRRTAFAALSDAYPVIGYWMMVIFMTMGMLTLMLLQKSQGRYCVEMTLAMVVPVALLTVLALCSVIPFHVLFLAGDPIMIIAMGLYMLYRPHNHTHEKSCHTA